MTSGVKKAPPTPLARRLRLIRESARLTQAQMGEHVGTRANRVSDWETGLHTPGLLALERYAHFNGQTVSELLEGVL